MRPSFMVKMVRKNHKKENAIHFSKKHLDYKVSEQKNLFYKNDHTEWHSMDIFGPKDSEESLPVIVMIHGGGYVCGDKFINEAQSKYFATEGFRVVNINYSLQPEADFIEVVKELFSVLHWCEENAEQYRFNKDAIFVCGDSAGGHYALLIAAVSHSVYLQEYFGVTPNVHGIKGVAASCPMTEVRCAKEKKDSKNRFLRKNVLHNGRWSDDIFIDNVSIPYLLDKCEFPDVFILTTETDSLLYEETKQLHEIMIENNVSHHYKEYLSVENKLDHVFNVVNPEWKEALDANRDIKLYFNSKL